MLKAVDKNGKVIILAGMSPFDIKKYKQTSTFFCPTCKEKVIIKAGSIRLAHFSHQSNSDCPFSKGGEGAYHERGKLQLYRWLINQRMKVQLEAYIPEIKQRPDILIMLGNKVVALEYQCARISEEDFLSRNSGYMRIGITPIWILGGNRMRRKGKNSLLLSSSDFQFLHQFSNSFPLTIYYYCSDSEIFSIFQHVQATGKKKTIGNLYFNRLKNISFIDLFKQQQPNPKSISQYWKEEMLHMRTKPNIHISNQERKWRHWLYQKGIYHTLLPSIVHLPVVSQYLMNTPPWMWQSRILIDLLQSLKPITLDMCHSLLKNEHTQTHYPLITEERNPFSDYLDLLVELRYVKKQAPFTYQLVKNISFPQTINDAIKEDHRIMQLFHSSSFPTHDSFTDTIY